MDLPIKLSLIFKIRDLVLPDSKTRETQYVHVHAEDPSQTNSGINSQVQPPPSYVDPGLQQNPMVDPLLQQQVQQQKFVNDQGHQLLQQNHRREQPQDQLEDSDYWTSTYQVQLQGQGKWFLQELPEGQGAIVTLESGGHGINEPRDPLYEGGFVETRYRREMIRFPTAGRRPAAAPRSRSPPMRRASSPPVRRVTSPVRRVQSPPSPRVIDLTLQGQTAPRREVPLPLATSLVVTTHQEVVIPVYPGAVVQRSFIPPLTRRDPADFSRRAPEYYPSRAPDGYIGRAPENFRGPYPEPYPICSYCYQVGHPSEDCPRMRLCVICTQRGHLADSCPHGRH